MPVLRERLSEPRVASAPAHTHRSEPKGRHASKIARPAPVAERARERDTIAETHFRSDISDWMGWYVTVSHRHAISHNVNTILLQRAPNLFNLLLIHTTNANATINLTVTVLNNFELKRDTVQTKNYLPAQ